MSNETKLATIEKRKRSKIAWIIPIIALLSTIWLINKSINEAGVDIIVNFKNANGFKAGKTAVVYKGYNLGKVKKITVGKDLTSVDAHINISKEAANFITREGTEFWTIRPKFSVSEISGLDTIISGVYIEVKPKTTDESEITLNKKKFRFIGYTEKPVKDYEEDGINITLSATDLSGINVGTPIYYKKFKVGEVIATKLLNNRVDIFINIQKKYNNLINTSTIFWNISGVKLNANLGGLNLEMDSLITLFSGGITFETFNKDASKDYKNTKFMLHNDLKGLQQDKSIVKLILKDAKGITQDETPIIYKGIQIGKIKSIMLNNDDGIIATAFIDKRFSKFNKSGTKYYKVDAKIGLSGIENIDTILKGNYLNIIPGPGKYNDTFVVYDSQENAIKKQSYEISIKSDKLYNLKIGSSIFYKNVVVGSLLNYKFTEDLKEIIIKAGINKKYKHLINDKTLFYSISTPLIESKNLDVKVNFEGIDSLLNGGIGLEYTKSNDKNDKKRFWLYDSYIDLLKVKQKYTKGTRINVQINEDIKLKTDTPIFYKNTKIGFIESYNYLSNPSYAVLFIENIYKKNINKESKFYIQNAIDINASLNNGIELKLSSFESLLKGGVILTNKNKNIDNNIQNNFKYKLYDGLKKLPVKGLKLRLKAKDSGSLTTQSSIYYKKIKVGVIKNIDLNTNAKYVNIDIFIYDKYQKLIRSNTKFYNVSGFDIDVSLVGANIKADSLNSVMFGGISFSTPDEFGKKAKNNSNYILHDEAEIQWLEYNPEILLK